MTEQTDTLLQVDEAKREDVYLKDFINKRSLLLNDTLRQLSQQCVVSCEHLNPEVDAQQFTVMEQQCLAKCEAKVTSLTSIVERHLSDTFNPTFVAQFMKE